MIAGVIAVHVVAYTTNRRTSWSAPPTLSSTSTARLFFFLTAFVLCYSYGKPLRLVPHIVLEKALTCSSGCRTSPGASCTSSPTEARTAPGVPRPTGCLADLLTGTAPLPPLLPAGDDGDATPRFPCCSGCSGSPAASRAPSRGESGGADSVHRDAALPQGRRPPRPRAPRRLDAQSDPVVFSYQLYLVAGWHRCAAPRGARSVGP